MQTSILTLLLALGLPGANSCNAQQQGLPRVGQTPPATTQGEEPTPPVADSEDADEPEEMDADDADEAGAEMFEIAATDAEDSPCPEAQAKSDCKAHCKGSGSSQAGDNSMLGMTLQSGELPYLYAGDLAQDGQVLRLKEGDLNGKVKKLTLQPGSTVILETKNGKQVVVRTQGLGGTLGTTETLSVPTLAGLFASGQAAKQSQDDRVRELEQRVRELEAQLRERDGQPRAGQPFQIWPKANAEAREKAAEERAQARELRGRMSAQARDYAKQARQQAEEERKKAEEIQKQALEQADVWRARTKDSQAKDMLRWKARNAPHAAVALPKEPGDDYVEVQPAQPPMAETAP